MSSLLNEIEQITIYLKEARQSERVHEVVLFAPFYSEASHEETRPLRARKWSHKPHLSFHNRAILALHQFFYHRLPFSVPQERKSGEAKLKTTLALLLTDGEVRDFFLGSEDKRRRFFSAVKRAAVKMGYCFDTFPSLFDKSLKIANTLTKIAGHERSLIEDPLELHLQIAALTAEDRDEILFTILSEIERPPLTSIIEIGLKDASTLSLEMTTLYGDFEIKSINNEQIVFSYKQNQAKAAIGRRETSEGVMNQRVCYESEDGVPKAFIGSYSGELVTPNNVLEEILFMLQEEKGTEFFLLDHAEEVEEKTILFTSLFSWLEYDKILAMHHAIDDISGKVLKVTRKDGQSVAFRLCLIHQNIPLAMSGRLPVPSEIKAHLFDLNDQALILLGEKILGKNDISMALRAAKKEKDFLLKEKKILAAIDAFRKTKIEVIKQLERATSISANALEALLKGKKNGIDTLILTSLLARELEIMHHKNCHLALDRTSAAMAIDKSVFAFRKVTKTPFFPGKMTPEEESLFKIFYSMYLMWEEPEINATLSSGFVGGQFFKQFVRKNPEVTAYLMPWIKKHSELALGH